MVSRLKIATQHRCIAIKRLGTRLLSHAQHSYSPPRCHCYPANMFIRSKMSGQGEWQGFSDREIRTLQPSPQQKRIAFKETVRSKPSGSSVKDQQHQAQGKRGSVGAKRQGYGGSFPTNSPPVDGLSERAFFTNPVVPENVEHECDGNTDAKPDDTRVPCSDEDRNTTTSREGPQPQHTESGINFSDK